MSRPCPRFRADALRFVVEHRGAILGEKSHRERRLASKLFVLSPILLVASFAFAVTNIGGRTADTVLVLASSALAALTFMGGFLLWQDSAASEGESERALVYGTLLASMGDEFVEMDDTDSWSEHAKTALVDRTPTDQGDPGKMKRQKSELQRP